MIVVQRISDNKFWRNTTGRGKWHPNDDSEWLTDVQGVKPYRNKAAALHSFSVGYIYWGKGWSGTPCPFVGDCCTKVSVSWRGVRNACAHYKAAKEAARTKFFAKYRLVEVRLQITNWNVK
jgi:hypothetical protein